jgi:hypothetical protein
MAAEQDAIHHQLTAIVRASGWFMPALRAACSLHLESWCIGAGAVRNLVWDHLHGYASPSALADVDLAYFDSSDLRPQAEQTLQALLCSRLQGVPWEVTNQAAVHLWFEGHFGHPVAALGSLQAAVASWPEFTTCVGVTLAADGSIGIIAPHGLDDLFAMRVQRNPARVSVATYRHRVATKRYAERWPRVTVVPC